MLQMSDQVFADTVHKKKLKKIIYSLDESTSFYYMDYAGYLQGMLSHGMIPRRVILEEVPKVKFLRTHSISSTENSFRPSMTTSTRLGSSIDPGDSSNITSCANVVLLIGKQLGILVLLKIINHLMRQLVMKISAKDREGD